MTKDPQAKRKPENCAFVIFGATGDLTHRLVMPSLYNLAAEHLLPEKFCVVGVARNRQSDDELRDSLLKGLRQFATRPVDDDIARKLLECVTFVEADPKDPRPSTACARIWIRWNARRTPAATDCSIWQRRLPRSRRLRASSAAPA